MTDLMTNVAPEATETQRACDIIRKVRDLFDNGANWIQNSWAKRVYPLSYDGSPYLSNYDQNGRTLSPTDPKATKFCLVGAVAHVTGQDYENYRY